MADRAAPTRAEKETEPEAALTDELTDEDLEIVAGAGGAGPPPFIGTWDDMGMGSPELTDPFDWFS